MSTIDSYLEALIALSGDEQLVSPRRALLQSLNDEDLAGLVKKAVGREFARGDLEDIASVLLDIIVKDPASVYSHDAGEDQATQFVLEEQYLSHHQFLDRQARRLHRVCNHKLATLPVL
ncbi:hypothetical protein GT037_000034 [Alternaria burnsii]|uniref:Uncharacterized protein n=1 Tax=Alternaria burnsii TaxID=1187904 RepID=A0A8H7BFN5_9PLEO|nr:uncharacterized protein GT037_000034 [Alternaria burnsii]KAF7681058.1 hypothetical protein GT037_000034 [Alternaria burnsii]